MRKGVRKHTFNESYFDTINTERKAYWLGFISADGSVTNSNKKTKSMRLRININIKDEYLLKEFKKDIEAHSTKLRYYTSKVTGISDSPQVSITLNSNKLCDSLAQYEVKPRKTYSISFPNIDDKMLPHFFRGFFDGDGYMNYYPQKQYPNSIRFAFEIAGASEKMANGIQDYLSKNNITSQIYIRKPKTNGVFIRKVDLYRNMTGSKSSVLKIIKLMYENATIYMERKKCIADKIVEISRLV